MILLFKTNKLSLKVVIIRDLIKQCISSYTLMGLKSVINGK